MSTQLTGASAKVLFESPAQLNLKKKLLAEGNFEIVSSGPESATNLDKGITIVRTKQIVSRDALTDEPVYAYKEFPIKHARENIADVFRRRLGRDAEGQLTVPGLSDASLEDLNVLLEEYGIYLEPTEFTITKQGEAAFTLTAKNNCVIFYGKISFTNTTVVKVPLEVYVAEGAEVPGEGETEQPPSTDNGSSESEGDDSGDVSGSEPPPVPTVIAFSNVKFDVATNTLSGDISGDVDNVVTSSSPTVFEIFAIPVVNGKFTHTFETPIPNGTFIDIYKGAVRVNLRVSAA